MKLFHLPPEYRKLDYEHKKYIVAELAKFMVEKGLSSLEESQAGSLLESALQHFPDHAEAKPLEMRRTFVERSGLLRPSGVNRIDFLHNTLKEYLSAGRFVTDDKYKLLASHADDDAWQPVILFAAALPTPGFASRLLQELLSRVRPSNNRRHQKISDNRLKGTPITTRNREFFILRCRNAAFRLDPNLVTKVTHLASGLFPPNTIADAEALASLGDAIIPNLDSRQLLTTRQKVACISTLRMVGGSKARNMIRKFSAGKSKSVILELLAACSELGVTFKLTTESLDLSSSSVRSLAPLKGQATLRHLNIADTRISDLSPISNLKGLRNLNLRDTEVENLTPISGLAGLERLHLSGRHLADFSPLRRLQNLRLLNIGRSGQATPWQLGSYWGSYWGSHDWEALMADKDFLLGRFHRDIHRKINVYGRRFRDFHIERSSSIASQFSVELRKKIAPFRWALFELEHRLSERRVFDPEFLSFLATHPKRIESIMRAARDLRLPFPLHQRVRHMQIDWPMHFDIPKAHNSADFLRPSPNFNFDERLTLSGVPETNDPESWLAPLSNLKHLEIFVSGGLPVYDLSPLSKLKHLSHLHLPFTVATDLSPLAYLHKLIWLDLSFCPANDYSPLQGHTSLLGLDLSYAAIHDLSPLKTLTSLQGLSLAGTQTMDFSPLFGLSGLRILFLSRSARTDRNLTDPVLRQLKDLKRINPQLRIHRL